MPRVTPHVRTLCAQHFLVAKTFEELEPERQADKMRYVFRKYDTKNSGFITPVRACGLLHPVACARLRAADG